MAERLDPETIKSLVINKAPESHRLEYKREIPIGKGAEDIKEFLADVSAMANTIGGNIIYGIDEERDSSGQPTGLPESIVGVSIENEDALRRAWEERIAMGLSPSLRRVEIVLQEIDGKDVLVLSIPRSLRAPHAVWYQRSGKYFRRSSSGKYQVDPSELKIMFLEHDAWEAEAQRYRQERVELIANGGVLSTNLPRATTVVHILPLGRLRESVVSVTNDLFPGALHLWSHARPAGFDYHPTIDGFIIHGGDQGSWPLGYVQILRFGGIEVCVGTRHDPGTDASELFIPGAAEAVRLYVTKGIAYLQSKLNIEAPFAIAISLVKVGGVRGYFTNSYGISEQSSIRYLQPECLFPLSIVNEERDVDKAVAFLSEMLWNSAGFPAP